MIQSWGNDGRLANRRLERNIDSVRLSSLTYSYDANDNITAITDTLNATKTRTYAYDAIDRLTRTTGTLTGTAAGTYGREDFTYDKNGNRLKVERRATATALTPVETDTYTLATGTNRLRIVADTSGMRFISYDGRGNQIAEQFPRGGAVTVAYDGHARLTRYRNGGASQTMLYNGMDERIQVVTTPAIGLADTRVYLYDLDHRIVGEYGATGTSDIKAEYIWLMPEVGATGPTGGDDGLGGYMPLATAVGQTGALNWLHTHHHGAPILTTNATGTVVPYPAHAVLGFPGQFANSQQLAGAQHYYNRYRDYDVNTGRYIQADPIGLAGDDNPYAYAGGNPLGFMDPDGLQRAPRAPPPQIGYRPPNAFDLQIQAINARGRALNPSYRGFQQTGNGATINDVNIATNMFARAQIQWALNNGVCLGSGQPGANGIVYLRIDTTGGLAPYYGQAISPSRYRARQGEHARAFPSSRFQYSIADQALPGRPLTTAEQNAIQGLTGGVSAGSSPFVSNQRNPVGPARRPAWGLPEPK